MEIVMSRASATACFSASESPANSRFQLGAGLPVFREILKPEAERLRYDRRIGFGRGIEPIARRNRVSESDVAARFAENREEERRCGKYDGKYT